MANNPTVTLTFAGDSKQVARASAEVGTATDMLRDKIDKNSTSMARDTERSATEQARSLGKQRREYDNTAESFEDMVTRMIREKRRLDLLNKSAAELGIIQHPVYGYVTKEPASKAGDDAAESFADSFGTKLKTALGRVALPAAVVGLGLVSRFIGTMGLAAGAGLVTAIGAGMAGLGITVAAKSAVVQAHFQRLAVNVQAKMMAISKPFEQTLIDVASNAQRVFNVFAKELDKTFPQAAKDISEFTFNLAEGFRQLAPVVAPIMDAFGKILDSLGPQLPGVFQNIANALIPLAENVAQNSEGFADFVVFMLNLIPVALKVINAMITYGEMWSAVWGGVGNVITTVAHVIGVMMERVGNVIMTVASFIGGVLGEMRAALGQRFLEMLADVRNWPASFRAALGDLGRILWDAGSRLVGGLIDGIKARIYEVTSTLRNLTNMIPSWKGPVEVDAKLLTDNGRLIIGSLVDGFRQEEPDVRKYLGDLTTFIGGFGPDQPNLSAGSSRVSSEGRPRRVELGSDGTAMGDAMLQLIINAIRRAGGDPAVLGV